MTVLTFLTFLTLFFFFGQLISKIRIISEIDFRCFACREIGDVFSAPFARRVMVAWVGGLVACDYVHGEETVKVRWKEGASPCVDLVEIGYQTSSFRVFHFIFCLLFGPVSLRYFLNSIVSIAETYRR